jgi:hemerythrin-like domain-containing protein
MENRVEADKSQSVHTAHEAQAPSDCARHHCEKATELLSDEHRVIERVLAVVEKLTQTPVGSAIENWKKALDFFRYFADQCHHFKEEQVLFPAMEARGIPREGGPIGMMLMEHEEGRGHVRSMLAALTLAEARNEAAKDTLLENARAYLRLLREHIQKEDDILFRIADDVIPADEQKELLSSFEKHEVKEMGTGVHEKYLTITQELEDSVA